MVSGKPNGFITAFNKFGAFYEGNYCVDRFSDFGRLIAAGGNV